MQRTLLYIVIIIVIGCNNDNINEYPGHTINSNSPPQNDIVSIERINTHINIFEEQYQVDIYSWRREQIQEYILSRHDSLTNNEILVLIFEYNTKERNLWKEK